MVYTNSRSDCCYTVAVRTQSTHTTHASIYQHIYRQMLLGVVHTRIAVVSVAVSNSSKQSKKKQKTETWGCFRHTGAHAPTHEHTHRNTHRTETDMTSSRPVGGNTGRGLLHATNSSCWCCCCGSVLLLVEAEVLPLLCPSKELSEMKQGLEHRGENLPCLNVLQQKTEQKIKSQQRKTC